MYKFYKSIFVIFLFLQFNQIIECRDRCEKTSACSCAFPSGQKVDLSPLDSKDQNNPTFADISPDTGNDQFSWNPCSVFDEGQCVNVSVCNIHQNEKGAEYFPIGMQDTAAFTYNYDGFLQITYQYEDTTQKVKRSSFIALKCTQDNNAVLEANGENPAGSGQYYFVLTSPFTCYPTDEHKPKNGGGGLSKGSFICIGFFGLVFVYIVAGIAFQSVIRKAQGRERIPNVQFWTAIPGLVKDGIVFVFTRGKRSSYAKL